MVKYAINGQTHHLWAHLPIYSIFAHKWHICPFIAHLPINDTFAHKWHICPFIVTPPRIDLLCMKNWGTHWTIEISSNESLASMAIEKIKIMEAVFNCHGCWWFIWVHFHCPSSALIYWTWQNFLTQCVAHLPINDTFIHKQYIYPKLQSWMSVCPQSWILIHIW